MIEGLKIPVWDKTVRLIVHEPHRFATPPDIVAASELELGYEVNV